MLVESCNKILIVDDVASNIQLAASVLKGEEYRLAFAQSGIRALELARDNQFDLILLDVMMPEMDGIQTCRLLKETPGQNQDTPVIFLTARNEEKSVERAFDAGAVDYIPKPFAASELKARVRNHLENQAMKRALQQNNRELQQKVDAQVRQISAAHMAMIFAMARLAESRDTDTGQHLERISAYTCCLLEGMAAMPAFTRQIDQQYIRTVCRCSALHDIGKVAIPDVILNKPGRFLPMETAIMQTHARIGADTLRSVEEEFQGIDMIRHGIEIAECHHERWDGGGYPDGRTKEDIPLAARVVALADVFDALTSKRCYKPAYSLDESTDILFAQEEGRFDPRVLQVFRQRRGDILGIYHRLHVVEAGL